MKSLTPLLLIATLALGAGPALANWNVERLPEATPSFNVFTNDLGYLSAESVATQQILIHKSEARENLAPNGSCSFDNCVVSVIVDGQRPAAGERVNIYFSQGDLLEIEAASDDALFSNSDWDGKQTTNQFVRSIALAEWVIISFGDVSNRFSLSGSRDAFGAVAAALN